MIPSILYLRGYLANDFYSSSTENTPYALAAQLLSSLIPVRGDSFLVAYSTLSVLFLAFSTYLNVILCIFLVKYLLSIRTPSDCPILYWKKYRYLITVYFAFLFAPPPFIDRLFTLNPTIFSTFAKGFFVAEWTYPVRASLNPTGISDLIIVFTILFSLTQYFRKNIRVTSYASYFVPFILFFVSTLLHPVIPIIGLGLLLTIFILNCTAFLGRIDLIGRRYWMRVFFFCSLGWSLAIVVILKAFPQPFLSPNDFFQIYVVDRHPHHYLPSYYLFRNRKSIVLPLLNIAFLLLSVRFAGRFKLASLLRSIALLALSVLLAVHLSQYILVEVLRLDLFIGLGISRASSLFNLLYVCWFAILLICCLEYIDIRINPKLIESSMIKMVALLSWARALQKGILILIIAVICAILLLLNSIYTQRFIISDESRLLSRAINSPGIVSNREIVLVKSLSGRFKFIREIGLLNVYSDLYFPFSKGHVLEYGSRRKKTSELLDCIESKGVIKSCVADSKISNPLLLVSNSSYTDIELYKKVVIGNESIYLYPVNSLNTSVIEKLNSAN